MSDDTEEEIPLTDSESSGLSEERQKKVVDLLKKIDKLKEKPRKKDGKMYSEDIKLMRKYQDDSIKIINDRLKKREEIERKIEEKTGQKIKGLKFDERKRIKELSKMTTKQLQEKYNVKAKNKSKLIEKILDLPPQTQPPKKSEITEAQPPKKSEITEARIPKTETHSSLLPPEPKEKKNVQEGGSGLTVEQKEEEVKEQHPFTPKELGSLHETASRGTKDRRTKIIKQINNYNSLSAEEKEKIETLVKRSVKKYPDTPPRELAGNTLVRIPQSRMTESSENAKIGGGVRRDFIQRAGIDPADISAKDIPKDAPKTGKTHTITKTETVSEPKKEKEVKKKFSMPSMEFPSTTLVVSKKFGGKTNLILNIVLPNMKKFDNIFVITLTGHLGRLKAICPDEDCMLEDVSDEGINEILKMQKEGGMNTLLVFDDVLGMNLGSKAMMKLATSGRNFGISVIMSVQDVARLPKTWTKNAEYVYLGKMTHNNMEYVGREFSQPTMSKKRIIEELAVISKDSAHDWLFYDDRSSKWSKILGKDLKKYF